MSSAGISLTECSDKELARRAAAGDVEAFEQIYARHHRRVYALCLRMTQNVSDAEDLTQGVFIQLFRQPGSFRCTRRGCACANS